MAEYNIGRILPIFKGTWNSSTSYSKLDVVYHSGNSYVASASSKGAIPSTTSSVWQILAAKGDTGATGAKGDKGEAAVITDGCITTAKIANGAVTNAKLSTEVKNTLSWLETNFNGSADKISTLEEIVEPLPSAITTLQSNDMGLNREIQLMKSSMTNLEPLGTQILYLGNNLNSAADAYNMAAQTSVVTDCKIKMICFDTLYQKGGTIYQTIADNFTTQYMFFEGKTRASYVRTFNATTGEAIDSWKELSIFTDFEFNTSDYKIYGYTVGKNNVGSQTKKKELVNLSTIKNALSNPILLDGSISTSKIANGAVTTAKLGASSVDSNNIANGAVSSAKLANSSVTKDKIADDAVTSGKIKDRAVTMDKLSVPLETLINSTLDDLDKLNNTGANRLAVLHQTNTDSAEDLSSLSERFRENKGLIYAPNIDFEYWGTYSMTGTFYDCSNLIYVPVYDSWSVTDFSATFYDCTNLIMIESLDLECALNAPSIFDGCVNLDYCVIKNLGTEASFNMLDMSQTKWGFGGSMSAQSVIDSLITHSFNRAEAGYPTCTIKLPSYTYTNVLNSDLRAQITDKGYTLIKVE